MKTMMAFGQTAGPMRPPVSASMRVAAQYSAAATASITVCGSTRFSFSGMRASGFHGLVGLEQLQLLGQERPGLRRVDIAVGEGELVVQVLLEVLRRRGLRERRRHRLHDRGVGAGAHDD